MRTRREFLAGLFSAGAVGLSVACGGATGGGVPAAATSAPAKPAATSGAGQPAAAPTAPPPGQTGPGQAAGVVGYGAVAPTHFAFDPSFKPFEKADPEGAK